MLGEVTVAQLELCPVSFADACAFVAKYHRHNKPPVGHKFSIGVESEGKVVGVAMIGRPVARMSDDGVTLEVNRTATDGTPHVNSMLYGAAWRAAKAMGYRRLITYTQHDETGTSLRAAGFRVIAQRPARPGWDRPSRPRAEDESGFVQRTLWEVSLSA